MSLRLGGRLLPVIGRARVYVCGITPYDTTHLGHAATFVWTDAAVRVLRRQGVEVEVCRNITDVDDDLLAEARATGVDWRHLATRETYRFEEDMRALRIPRPTAEPQSHNFVDEVVALAAALLELGHAYEREGSVYFRGAGVPERVGLGRAEAERLAGERGGRLDDPAKDDPLDVVVWQRSAAGEPAWPSPWGAGRPGWHAECTAMALATLGPAVDLHGGGADLAFPHHAYEAAQAEAVTGVVPFSRRWMHVGTVRHGGAKIAKSTGNLVFVHDLLERWPAEAVRLLILDRRWDEPWDFREDDLDAAADRVDRLSVHAGRPLHRPEAEAEVLAALGDDLDVPRALDVAEEAGGSAARVLGDVLAVLEARIDQRTGS